MEIPAKPGLVNDSRVVYDYVKNHCKDNIIIVWGHSMGSGVSTRLVMDLSVEGIPPHGLVLESPFNNLRDVIMNHLLSIPVRWMPESMVQKILIQPLRDVELKMETDKRIKAITCPILILHAENDHVIPVFLARKLRDEALAASRDVQYVEFEEKRNYKHKFIYMAPELSTLIPAFIEHTRERASLRDSL
ncbi:hypothetical protein COOONC_07283 [Cooperia oncophora]